MSWREFGKMSDNRPDILVFFSDQHSANRCGFMGDPVVQTPHLDQLARDGSSFHAAYTSCPLCVPARMSMLTGALPSHTGIFSNFGVISSDKATFITALAAAGYETVLCGRMHFLGPDQRHGFTKRLVGDITPTTWGMRGEERTDLGRFQGTLSEQGCLRVVGKGPSPVLDYDCAVVEEALAYLRQKNHDKPQCLVIGTYSPHFPYAAPARWFDYYRDKCALPESLTQGVDYSMPMLEYRRQPFDEALYRDIQAAYNGMISFTDELVGEVRREWQAYLMRRQNRGVFVYLSDHGDQAGDRNLFAKQTFFDSSAKIPMIFQGDGIAENRQVSAPVSIMDVGATLCGLANADYPVRLDGVALNGFLDAGAEGTTSERAVLSELIETNWKSSDCDTVSMVPGRMVRRGDWKMIAYAGWEQSPWLFNLADDPHELYNLYGKFPQLEEELMQIITQGWDPERLVRECRENRRHDCMLAEWARRVRVPQHEMWRTENPERYR